jgi:hypothetical protein
LVKHYEQLPTFAPSLIPLQLKPESAYKDPIILPSSFTLEEQQTLELEALAKVEIELCIGYAHDLVDHLRRALGVRSVLTRHARDQRGYGATTRAQDSINFAEQAVKIFAKGYRRCWAALESLEPTGEKLLGLQSLEEKDLVLLGDWLEEERYRSKDTQLPWIWTAARIARRSALGEEMLGVEEGDEDLSEFVRRWNEEGMCEPSPDTMRRQPLNQIDWQLFGWNGCMLWLLLSVGRRKCFCLRKRRGVLWPHLSMQSKTGCVCGRISWNSCWIPGVCQQTSLYLSAP